MAKSDFQPLDEEALLLEFGTANARPEEAGETEAEPREGGVSSEEYARQVQAILDHPVFRELGAHEQLLYLQLHRHCQGAGHHRVWVSIAEMSWWTQRAGKNVCQTLRRLRENQTTLVTLNVRPRPFKKGQYQIHPLPASPTSHISIQEMSNRIDTLTDQERQILDQQIASLTDSERQKLRNQARLLFKDLVQSGFSPVPSIEDKAYRYLAYISTTGVWRIAQLHSNWVPQDTHH